ncbi:ABC transporter substrate-binding protein [Spirochaetia bacterium]|nr:ABC transporter substrate-binding protein [Spirochaetia bacterium]
MKKVLLGLGLCLILAVGCSKPAGDGGQYTKLTMAFFSGARLDDMAPVTEELNKIARAKAGVEIALMPIDWSAWDQQINLMISGGEKLDLLPVLGENYATTIGQGKLAPMEQYLTGTAGKAMTDVIGPVYMAASLVDGHTYGVPSLRDMVRSYGLVMRKDLVEKYNIDVDSLNTIDDLDRMFAKVKAGEPNMYMIFPQGNWHGIVFQLFHDRDPLGDDLGVLMNRGQGALKVENLYATADYARYVRKIREWYLKGYIPQDAITTPDGGNAMIGAGTLFATCANLKPGYAGETSMTMDYELAQKDFISPYATTRTVTSLMWTLPVTGKTPEKAVDALSLLYTDAAFINLIDFGIEGKHYVKMPGYDNMITYPSGVTANNTGWDMFAGWIFGDQLKSYVWEGNPPDLYQQLDAFNKNALISKAMGFEYDSSPVKTAVASVTNVVSEYRLSLEYGVVDPDTALPRFIQALKNAGIDEIIAEKQKQLDAWAAAK